MKKSVLFISMLCIAFISNAQLGKQIGKSLSKVKQTQNTADKDKYYQRIEDENKIDEFVKSSEPTQQMINNALAVDISTLDMSKFLPHIISNADNIDFMIKTLKRDLGFGSNNGYNRYEAVKKYWEICAKFYPNEAKIQQSKEKIDALAAEYKATSKETYTKNANDEYAKKIANKTMPPAVKTDKNLEELFTTAFNNESKKFKEDRTILKINITTQDWKTVRKEYTGVLLGREQYAAIVYKNNTTGECKMSKVYIIYQEYTGSGYSSTATGRSFTGIESFPCENINK